MEVLDGDLDRFGWELRTVDVPAGSIGELLLPKAVSLMRDTSSFAQDIRFYGGRWPKSLPLEITDNREVDFLRTGCLTGGELDKDALVRMLAQARMPKLKYPKGLIRGVNEFARSAQDIFGPIEEGVEADDLAQSWRVVRNLSQPLGMQAWMETKHKGHCDDVREGTHVSSIQLSERPSLWTLRYCDRYSGQLHTKKIEQAQGQEVFMRSTASQLPLLETKPKGTQAVTPYHHVVNKSERDSRYSYIRYLAVLNRQAAVSVQRKWYRLIPGFRKSRAA